MKNKMEIQIISHKTRLLKIFFSEQGSFAVIFAVSLMVMISLMAFAMDLGYFVKEKSNYQASVDAAALSAAENLCYGRATEAAEMVIYGSGVLLPDDSVKVEFGYYDSYNEYENFSEFCDFIREDNEDFPEFEANNAVMVTIENKVQALTGFNKAKTIRAAAVAYIPRVDVVAGGILGFTNLHKHNFNSISNGNLFSNKRMGIGHLENQPSVLGENAKAASNEIITYTTRTNSWPPYIQTIRPSDKLPEIEVINKYILDNPKTKLEEYVEKMKEIADIVYTPEDSGKGHFYGSFVDQGNLFCYFDLSKAHEDHQIIFFDTSGYAQRVIVKITPYACAGLGYCGGPCLPPIPNYTGWLAPNTPCMQQIGKTTAMGNSIKNITFVADCEVEIPSYHLKKSPIPIGGENSDQVNIISTEQIKTIYGNNAFRGVNLYGDNIYIYYYHSGSHLYLNDGRNRHVRAISVNDIRFDNSSSIGGITYNFRFGPPCPPVTPITLGRLIEVPVDPEL